MIQPACDPKGRSGEAEQRYGPDTYYLRDRLERINFAETWTLQPIA